MASRSLQYLDRMAGIRSNDPALRLELSRGYLRLGTILEQGVGLHDSLGQTIRAIEADRKALALVGNDPGTVDGRRLLASIERQLGANLARAGKHEEAFSWLLKGAEDSDRLARAEPASSTAWLEAGSAWETYAVAVIEKGGYVSTNAGVAKEPFMKAAERLNTALRKDPGNSRTLTLLAETYDQIGKSESSVQPRTAVDSFHTALGFIDSIPPDHQTAEVRRLHALLLLREGWAHGQLNDFKEALRNIEEAAATLDRLSAEDPGNFTATFRRVEANRSLGLVEGYAGHPEKSVEYLRKAAEILTPLAERDQATKMYAGLLAELQGRVANLMVKAGHKAEALPFAEASIAYYKRLGDNPDASPQQLIEAVRSLGETEIKPLRDPSAALRFALRADALASGNNPAVLGYVAEAYELNGRFPDAAQAAGRGLALVQSQGESQLRTWLRDELTKNQARADRH